VRWSLGITIAWVLLALAHVPPFAAGIAFPVVALPFVLGPVRRWGREIGRLLARVLWMNASLVVVWARHPGFANRWYLRPAEPTYLGGHRVPTTYEFMVEVLHLELPGLLVIEVVALVVTWWISRRRRLYGPLGQRICT
jgi:hypothetical protein